MPVPFFKEIKIGAYLMRQKLMGNKRYPLVLMLEPLFRCNLACAGCGKIDYPDPILNRRLSVQGGRVDAHGDHRIAMLGAVAGIASREGVEVDGFEAAAVSYPAFADDLHALVTR